MATPRAVLHVDLKYDVMRAFQRACLAVAADLLREQLDSRIALLHNTAPGEQQTGEEALANFRQWLDLVTQQDA